MTQPITTALRHAFEMANMISEWSIKLEIDGRELTADELKREFSNALMHAQQIEGNARPVITEMGLYRCLEEYIQRAGSAKAAAQQLGISPSFLSQIRHAGRSMPAHVVHRLGFQKKREFEGI